MNAVDQIRPERQFSPEEAARITISWPDLQRSPIKNEEQCAEIEWGIENLTVPADRAWVMARVVALLLQYFTTNMSQLTAEMTAEDWAEAIGCFPQWCITSAVRWWKSADNPDRKRRPLEGDIQARCRREFGVVQIARVAVRRYREGGVSPQVEALSQRVTAEKANAIMTQAGFMPKRFGGDA